MRILFQGDSITDTGRDRDSEGSLGAGYVNKVAEKLRVTYPSRTYECLNKGISGNRVIDLQGRWQEDCLDLMPDVLSILIGVNDVWRKYDSNDPTHVEDFENIYRDILTQAQTKTQAKLILLEPFLLHTPADRAAWREDLDPKRLVVKKLAEEFKAVYIEFDQIMTEKALEKSPEYWAADGVHPTDAGHDLIADRWIEVALENHLI